LRRIQKKMRISISQSGCYNFQQEFLNYGSISLLFFRKEVVSGKK
jgi:hypothetical protein